MTDEAEERRRQAIERAARALTRAIVDLVEAASLPRNDGNAWASPAPDDPPDVLTLPEVVAITGLSAKTFYNLRVKGGGPPFFVVRNRLRCYRSDLDAWIRAAANE